MLFKMLIFKWSGFLNWVSITMPQSIFPGNLYKINWSNLLLLMLLNKIFMFESNLPNLINKFLSFLSWSDWSFSSFFSNIIFSNISLTLNNFYFWLIKAFFSDESLIFGRLSKLLASYFVGFIELDLRLLAVIFESNGNGSINDFRFKLLVLTIGLFNLSNWVVWLSSFVSP